MTDPAASQQDAELVSEGSTDEATADVNQAGEEGVAADYQTRLREFDQVESEPIVSLPVQSSQLEGSDLKLQPPGGQGG